MNDAWPCWRSASCCMTRSSSASLAAARALASINAGSNSIASARYSRWRRIAAVLNMPRCGSVRRAAGGRILPEIKEVEPVIRMAFAVALEQRRIALDGLVHRLVALLARGIGKIRDFRDDYPVSIAPAIQPGDEQ